MANPAIETPPPRDQTSGKFTKAAEPAKPSPEKTAAEQAGMRTFYEQHLHKKHEGKAPEKPAGEQAPAGEKKPDEPKKPAARRAARAPAAPAATAQEIGRVVGEAVREAIQPKTEKKDETPTKLDDGLGAEEKETLGILQEMAAINPDKHKDLPAKFAAGQLELKRYSTQWEKDNPGQEFDITSDEHASFVEKHNPDWEDGEFEKAQRNLLKKEVRDEVSKEFAPKLTEIEQREALREAQPVIHEAAMDSARQFWDQMPDDYKGVIKADGTIDQAALDKIQQADPDAYEELVKTARNLNMEIVELRKLFPLGENKPALAKFNPANPIHKAIDEFGVQLEADIMANPPDKRLNEAGKEFLPSDKFFALPKAERADHWTLTFQEVKDALILDRAERVKKAIKIMEDKFLQRARSRNLIKNDDAMAPATVQRTERQPAPNRNGHEEKPNGPGGQPASRMAATMRKSADEGKTAGSSFLNHAFKRK